MTEVEVYRPVSAEVAIHNDIDSWTQVAGQVIKLANEICDTPFVPDGLRGSVPATAAAILSGRELGLGPMTSLANIHVIKGKPALSAALMRALILAQGHQIETVDISDTRAVVRGRRKGEANWEEASFTADQARKANIQLGGYPQDKLYARATSRLARRKFADVIAGMPYAAEELEDGLRDSQLEVAYGDEPAEQPKPRTAQRKARTQAVPPAEPAAPSAVAAKPQDADPALPPLPGDDEPPPDDTDYDTPGTVTTPQITAVWTVLSTHFQFTKDERDQARMVCAQVIGRDLESTKNLSRNEAKAILDTLGHWRAQAEERGDDTRAYLIQMLAMAEEARHAGE